MLVTHLYSWVSGCTQSLQLALVEQKLLSPGSANRFHGLKEEHKRWMNFQEMDLAPWRLMPLLGVWIGLLLLPCQCYL